MGLQALQAVCAEDPAGCRGSQKDTRGENVGSEEEGPLVSECVNE